MGQPIGETLLVYGIVNKLLSVAASTTSQKVERAFHWLPWSCIARNQSIDQSINPHAQSRDCPALLFTNKKRKPESSQSGGTGRLLCTSRSGFPRKSKGIHKVEYLTRSPLPASVSRTMWTNNPSISSSN